MLRGQRNVRRPGFVISQSQDEEMPQRLFVFGVGVGGDVTDVFKLAPDPYNLAPTSYVWISTRMSGAPKSQNHWASWSCMPTQPWLVAV